MSGMDRLSDDKLKRMADGLFNALEMQLLDDLGSMARELLAHRRASQTVPAHEDDLAVDRFAAVMKSKLAKKRNDGRGGWSGPECSEETLSRMLRDHIAKGDPVDVANFAMMLHQRGERIAQAAPAPSDGLREAAAVVSAVLQSEVTRSGGKPFSGTWHIPSIDWRGTVTDALDLADAALTPAPAQEGEPRHD